MLFNHKSNGFLACDIYERISGLDEAYAVSTA